MFKTQIFGGLDQGLAKKNENELSSHAKGLTYSHGGAGHAVLSAQFTLWFNVFPRWRHAPC